MNAPYEWSTVDAPADKGALLKSELAKFESINDPTTAYEMVSSGYFGHLFGQNLIISKLISPNTIFILGEPQYVGCMPIRRADEGAHVSGTKYTDLLIDSEDEDISYDRDFSW